MATSFTFQNWDTNMSIFPDAPDFLGLSKFATQYDLGQVWYVVCFLCEWYFWQQAQEIDGEN